MEGKIIVKNPNGTSKAWDHFGFYKVGDQVLKDKAVCKICKQECKYTGGTTNLNQHLYKHHSELFSAGSSSKRRYFTDTLLPSMMENCRHQIKNEMETICGIGLTTDSWTSCATENYITYTAHYITNEWKMKSVVLSTQCSEQKHTSENLAEDMKKTEQNWGMDKLLFQPVYVHDNASNITKAPRVMNPPRTGIGCLAHTINLAANSATSIQQVSNLLTKARKVIAAFRKSTLAHIVFKNKQALLLPGNDHKLILDCATRWNSSYDMLERLHEQYQVWVNCLYHFKCTLKYFLHH